MAKAVLKIVGDVAAPAALPAERMPRLIALSKLKLDPVNVRKTALREDLAQLAEDIAAKGVLQNLIGRIDGLGDILITAGGRRLKALQALRGKKRIDGDYLVPVVIMDDDAAGEASLSENLQRVRLNPADECEAFEALRVGGMGMETIAARFGLTVRHVAGRLRLAGLAPVVLDALRKGKISLDVAQAFGGVDDQAMQAAVFGRISGYELERADSVRRAMRSEGYGAADPRVRLIDRGAYQDAGGRIEGDLFTPEAEELWLDTAIVDKLCAAALEVLAAEWQARFGFARVGVSMGYHPEDEQVEGLTQPEGYGRDWTQVPTEQRAQLVVFVTPRFGGTGDAVTLCREAWLASGTMLATLEPVPPPRAARETEAVAREERRDGGSEAAPDPVAEAASVPAALLDALAMRRRDILAFELVSSKAGAGIALDLMAFLVLDQAGKRFGDDGLGTSITVHDLRDPVTVTPLPWADDDLAESLASAWTASVSGELAEDWRAESSVLGRWKAFRALPMAARLDWQARAMASTLRAFGNNMQRTVAPLHAAIAAELAIDPAEHWRPTAANYFDRVNKAACIEFLEHGCGALDFPGLDGWKKLKKGEMATLCEQLAEGDTAPLQAALRAGDRDPIVKKVAARFMAWVPAGITWGNHLIVSAG